MLNQVLKVSSGTSVEVLSKSVIFLDFPLSQGSVATYCRWGGNLCDMYLKNFLTNHPVKYNFENRSTFAKVIIKHQMAYFFGTRCILCLMKSVPWCLIITLANVDSFSKFFHQFIHMKILYVPQRFLPHVQYVATLPCEIRKSKNVTEFLRWT